VGLNASTNADETQYYYSLPANRFELWAYLESERFLKPVMREFYKERDVVNEERRMRTDSQPVGRLIEQFLAAAFTAHPYGQPVVGWASDLNTFSATDAMPSTNYQPQHDPVRGGRHQDGRGDAGDRGTSRTAQKAPRGRAAASTSRALHLARRSRCRYAVYDVGDL
jgi:hypothetical protein